MKDLSIFAGVTLAEYELITSAAQTKYFFEGETVLEDGSPIRGVALLLTGSVKMTKITQNGNDVICTQERVSD